MFRFVAGRSVHALSAGRPGRRAKWAAAALASTSSSSSQLSQSRPLSLAPAPAPAPACTPREFPGRPVMLAAAQGRRPLSSGVDAPKTEPEELTFDMPMGKVRAQSWGTGSRPIIGLHGWLDNAGSLTPLAKRLPLDKFRLISLDLPGHGLSEKFPPGMNYSFMDSLAIIIRVQDHFNWPRSILLGHSLGGFVVLLFSACFPERVERLVALDFIGLPPKAVKKHSTETRRSVEESMKVQDKLLHHSVPSYDYDDAVARSYSATNLMHGMGSISKDSVKLLLERGLVKTQDGKVTWTADLRLRVPSPFSLTLDQAEHYHSQIDCPHLLIKASDSLLYMSEENADRILATYKNNNPDFEHHVVKGGHHVHMDKPDKVAKVVNKFLLREFKNKNSEDKDNAPFSI